ncbi:MAG: InlB B-repeat-containing protein, partial [Methylococcus sp.]
LLVSGMTLASSINYNLAGWPTGISSRVTIPPSWVPTANAPDYKGSLDVYWSLQIDTHNETLEVSKANAVAQGAPGNFTLITLPDNCWGMNMNYGLIKLGQAADVTITVTADGSSMAPIFALYQGWDTGTGASRHDEIFFGNDNPLGTTGLAYLGDVQNPTAVTTTSKTFTNLAAGKYELFTTVANNSNSGGSFKVTITTTPKKYALTVKKPSNGTIISPALGIDCGMASDKCQAPVPEGQSVTLSAIPESGFSFLGWTEPASCAGKGDCTFIMTVNTPVSAVFAEIPPGQAALTVGKEGQGRITSTPAGIDCGDGCSSTFTTYPIGTIVTLKATPSQGYTFAGWKGDCSGLGNCEVPLNGNKSVGALFSLPGECGAAISQSYEKQPPASELCSIGDASEVKQLSNGQFSWTCTGGTISKNCQTLSTNENAQCGSANNQTYTTAPTSPTELCAVGEPGAVTELKHKRFSWVCTGGSLAERCYTLGSNNKMNQAPLILSPGSQKVTVGQKKIIQKVSGGSGNGVIGFKKSTSTGTKCRLLAQGKKVRVVVRGEPGVCKITATKGNSRKYNNVESAPVTLTVTR